MTINNNTINSVMSVYGLSRQDAIEKITAYRLRKAQKHAEKLEAATKRHDRKQRQHFIFLALNELGLSLNASANLIECNRIDIVRWCEKTGIAWHGKQEKPVKKS